MYTLPKHPVIVWDTCDIAEERKQYLMEEEDMTEKEAEENAYNDPDLYSFEWDCLIDNLTELMEKLSHDPMYWYATVEGFGWRNQSGYKVIKASDGRTLLRELLPDTDCTFRIYKRRNMLIVRNWHHDSPMGNEYYTIRPARSCERCGECILEERKRLCEDCRA